MSIAPVIAEVDVRQPPERAFELFTARMTDWWSGKGIGANMREAIVVEPFAGGRWFETDAEGTETPWGRVLAWEPPSRLLLGWELDAKFQPSSELQTEVELTFAPLADGGTRVRLEHRRLERFGEDAARIASLIGGGWPMHLNEYAEFANEA